MNKILLVSLLIALVLGSVFIVATLSTPRVSAIDPRHAPKPDICDNVVCAGRVNDPDCCPTNIG